MMLHECIRFLKIVSCSSSEKSKLRWCPYRRRLGHSLPWLAHGLALWITLVEFRRFNPPASLLLGYNVNYFEYPQVRLLPRISSLLCRWCPSLNQLRITLLLDFELKFTSSIFFWDREWCNRGLWCFLDFTDDLYNLWSQQSRRLLLVFIG